MNRKVQTRKGFEEMCYIQCITIDVANQSKNAIKINFLSPLFGTTELIYERSIKPGRSWETALGIVGLGNDIQEIDPRGVYGKFAYKFMRSPDAYLQNMHYSHILKGAYSDRMHASS